MSGSVKISNLAQIRIYKPFRSISLLVVASHLKMSPLLKHKTSKSSDQGLFSYVTTAVTKISELLIKQFKMFSNHKLWPPGIISGWPYSYRSGVAGTLDSCLIKSHLVYGGTTFRHKLMGGLKKICPPFLLPADIVIIPSKGPQSDEGPPKSENNSTRMTVWMIQPITQTPTARKVLV